MTFAQKLKHDFTSLAFYKAWNDNIIYYGKRTADPSDFLLFHVCLDPHSAQGADLEVPLWEFGLSDDASIEVEDMVAARASPGTAKFSTSISIRFTSPMRCGDSSRRHTQGCLDQASHKRSNIRA
ncbi:hypothetical protein BQ8482_111161 [Mesorhizobium delmotii]|uniref:Alpha-1,4-glucan:maltose-1-phosphate maltosyltransferase C-terminal domain-containing protein n=2 Tax=Mesorhizobium delmotii TaxID=1631247 RepID=A0A2P9ADN2_9HYPH|nr:hypothetical protein BQ8482_111161 [Mesorhizobium delmotii]